MRKKTQKRSPDSEVSEKRLAQRLMTAIDAKDNELLLSYLQRVFFSQYPINLPFPTGEKNDDAHREWKLRIDIAMYFGYTPVRIVKKLIKEYTCFVLPGCFHSWEDNPLSDSVFATLNKVLPRLQVSRVFDQLPKLGVHPQEIRLEASMRLP